MARTVPKSRALAAVPAGSGLRPVPGDSGPPIVGYTLRFLHDPVRHGLERYARYGPVSWGNAFGKRFVGLSGPDACGVALQNRDRAFASGPGWSFFIGPFFERGLMLLDFDEHLHHRRIMQQAFTNKRLAGYLDIMNPAIEAGLADWRPGQLTVYPAMKRLTLDLATKVFMGEDLGTAADQVNQAFVACVRAGTAYVRFPVPGLRWWRGLRGRRHLEEFLAARLPEKTASDGDDLFSALCHAESDDGHRFTGDDVVNHMIFLMMAAHDTSTITMSTMAYHLGKYPEWQERCREQSLALGTDTVGYEDLDRLTDLELVMKESMRVVTPVQAVVRQTVKDTEVLGHYIPKDTQVIVGLHFTHHMPELWPEPERFDPERFAPHRREDKVHRHAWEPFGGGVHKCIGMYFGILQIKAVVHQLLLRYRWSVPPGYEMPVDFTSLPRPSDGLPVELERL